MITYYLMFPDNIPNMAMRKLAFRGSEPSYEMWNWTEHKWTSAKYNHLAIYINSKAIKEVGEEYMELILTYYG